MLTVATALRNTMNQIRQRQQQQHMFPSSPDFHFSLFTASRVLQLQATPNSSEPARCCERAVGHRHRERKGARVLELDARSSRVERLTHTRARTTNDSHAHHTTHAACMHVTVNVKARRLAVWQWACGRRPDNRVTTPLVYRERASKHYNNNTLSVNLKIVHVKEAIRQRIQRRTCVDACCISLLIRLLRCLLVARATVSCHETMGIFHSLKHAVPE
jgi:hypothetical protein